MKALPALVTATFAAAIGTLTSVTLTTIGISSAVVGVDLVVFLVAAASNGDAATYTHLGELVHARGGAGDLLPPTSATYNISFKR